MSRKNPDYFLISVSNRRNLNYCIKYGLAGFTNSINGLWTYLDISVGDFLSFLYGARVNNLYEVIGKVAYKNAENIPPWPPITLKMSGNTYYFPYRLHLKQIRVLDEPMIRAEFAYVAENLLLRGGYRKTHFQADGITLNNVTTMGVKFEGETERLSINEETFIPKIVFDRALQSIPETFYFREIILQSLLRNKLKDKNVLRKIVEMFETDESPDDFEVLGEKALPEGYVDILIKLRHPIATNKYILVEVKTKRASNKDFIQLSNYISEFGGEAMGGLLIAKDFPKRVSSFNNVIPVKYRFESIDAKEKYTYEKLFNMLKLEFP